jgi:hypothetical protein
MTTPFIVNLPNRLSVSPDAAYYIGPRTRGKFLEGAPVFAVEVSYLKGRNSLETWLRFSSPITGRKVKGGWAVSVEEVHAVWVRGVAVGDETQGAILRQGASGLAPSPGGG